MLEIKLDLAIQTTEFLSSLCEDLADVENVKGIIGQSTLDGDVVSCIVLISEDSDDVVEDILQLGIAVGAHAAIYMSKKIEEDKQAKDEYEAVLKYHKAQLMQIAHEEMLADEADKQADELNDMFAAITKAEEESGCACGLFNTCRCVEDPPKEESSGTVFHDDENEFYDSSGIYNWSITPDKIEEEPKVSYLQSIVQNFKK
mgnify:CR=1 FL=1